MTYRPILFAAISAFALTACQETPSETAKDVAQARDTAVEQNQEARQEANEDRAQAAADVTEAKNDMVVVDNNRVNKITKAESEAMLTAAQTKYDVAMTESKGRYNIENEKCDALKGVGEDACRSTIEATLAAEEAAITATRDSEIVSATYYE